MKTKMVERFLAVARVSDTSPRCLLEAFEGFLDYDRQQRLLRDTRRLLVKARSICGLPGDFQEDCVRLADGIVDYQYGSGEDQKTLGLVKEVTS
jgi:hypothetical protein